MASQKSKQSYHYSEDKVITDNAGLKSPEKIAELVTALGFRTATKSGIKARANRMGLSLRREGELYPFSTHSDHDVELCRQLHEAGVGPQEIAEKMEMKLSYVHSVVYLKSRLSPAKKAA